MAGVGGWGEGGGGGAGGGDGQGAAGAGSVCLEPLIWFSPFLIVIFTFVLLRSVFAAAHWVSPHCSMWPSGPQGAPL